MIREEMIELCMEEFKKDLFKTYSRYLLTPEFKKKIENIIKNKKNDLVTKNNNELEKELYEEV